MANQKHHIEGIELSDHDDLPACSLESIAAVLREAFIPLIDDLKSTIREVIREELSQITSEKHAPLDTDQACRRLNISRRKLDELVAAGDIRPLRIGRKRLFPAAQLDAFLKRCER